MFLVMCCVFLFDYLDLMMSFAVFRVNVYFCVLILTTFGD